MANSFDSDLEIYAKVQTILKEAFEKLSALDEPEIYLKGFGPSDAASMIDEYLAPEPRLIDMLVDEQNEIEVDKAATLADLRRDERLCA
jgi:hypothetical protein